MSKRAKHLNSDQIDYAATLIREGKLVAIPTETVYGLAADAFNVDAVASIFEAKKRPHFDPLIVHIADIDQIYHVAQEVPPLAQKLIEACWPGALTIILPKNPAIPDLVTAGLETVGIRLPNHEITRELIRKSGTAIAAPSANPFGMTSPTDANAVMSSLGDVIDGILDAGPCTIGLESTIISFAQDTPVCYRFGGLTLCEIEAVIGTVRIAAYTGEEKHAPGRSLRHYAPKTPLYIHQINTDFPSEYKIGLLTHTTEDTSLFHAVEYLSKTGDLREVARNLYAGMRKLDTQGCDVIIARTVPEKGLGLAINDRLRRAAEDALLH